MASEPIPGVNWLSHDAGHLLEMMFGCKADPHFGPFHVLSFIFIGEALASFGKAYADYAAHVPAFIPQLSRILRRAA